MLLLSFVRNVIILIENCLTVCTREDLKGLGLVLTEPFNKTALVVRL